ncbi:hypothetical protein JD844_019666 [Phrynosoma platyrhinos]|uniref:Nucleoside diphosphate kinase n=1 Tax=Phrynosoma platyrhinos TaxID=52577 RepID=A0ABQ7TPW9_PHRPL|nr:hypothetical protein JD844_019666 [Phrynosoma platyrhinos]
MLVVFWNSLVRSLSHPMFAIWVPGARNSENSWKSEPLPSPPPLGLDQEEAGHRGSLYKPGSRRGISWATMVFLQRCLAPRRRLWLFQGGLGSLPNLKPLVPPDRLFGGQPYSTEHYHELRRKPFYHELIQYMTSGPVVAMTNPAEAKPGTIRGDFSIHVSRNVVHASDSVETAQREISLWFRSNELVDWDCCDHKIMYEL